MAGTQNGAVWLHSGSFENYMANLNGKGNSNSTAPGFRGAATTNDTSNYLHNVAFGAGGIPFISDNNSSAGAGPPVGTSGNSTSSLKTRSVKSRQGSDYWLPELAPLGSVSNQSLASLLEQRTYSPIIATPGCQWL